MRAAFLPLLFIVSLPAHASTPALVEAECARAIALAEGRVAGTGVPYLTLDSRVDPEAANAREESLRVGLAVNLSDFARRSRASARGEADCERIKAKARAAGAEASARLSVVIAGLSARREAISASLKTAEKTLAERKRRLSARQETRARVDVVARTVAVLQQSLLDADIELSRVRREAEGFRPAEDPSALLASASAAAAASARATEDDVRGPAWDFTVGAGWAKKRTRYDGDTYYSTGQPYFAQVGIAWRPGVAFTRGAEADVVKGEIAPLEAAAAAWKAERQELIRMYEAKLALVAERLASVRADHAVAAASRLPDALVFADRLAQDEQGLAADEADWRARLVVLAAAPVAPTRAAEAQGSFSSISRVDTLTFTEGKADSSKGGTFTTKSTKIRARAEGAKGSRKLTAQFTYVGPTVKVEKLASGAERRQLGVFLAAKDQCNLLYVMWRLPDEIVVQRKLNPGKSTHDACGNDGYDTVKPEKAATAPSLKPGAKHTLTAALDAGRLDVEIDGRSVWSGPVNLNGLDAANGDAGWRSDNVEAEFSLARAGEAP